MFLISDLVDHKNSCMIKQVVLFMYSLPGSWTEYGPIECYTEKEARKNIRIFWGLKSTRGVDIRVTTREKEDLRYQEKKAFHADVLKANPHLCLTDF